MPPLARSLVDAYGTQVIDDWIRSFASCAGPEEEEAPPFYVHDEPGAAPADGSGTVVMTADNQGHFYVTGSVNGLPAVVVGSAVKVSVSPWRAHF